MRYTFHIRRKFLYDEPQLFNIHEPNVRQTEIRSAMILVPEPIPFEIEIATESLRRYKSPGTDQIPAELIQAGGRKFTSLMRDLRFSRR